MTFEEAQENIGKWVRSTAQFNLTNRRLVIRPGSQWILQSVDESTQPATVTASYVFKSGEEVRYQGLSLSSFITEKAYKSIY